MRSLHLPPHRLVRKDNTPQPMKLAGPASSGPPAVSHARTKNRASLLQRFQDASTSSTSSSLSASEDDPDTAASKRAREGKKERVVPWHPKQPVRIRREEENAKGTNDQGVSYMMPTQIKQWGKTEQSLRECHYLRRVGIGMWEWGACSTSGGERFFSKSTLLLSEMPWASNSPVKISGWPEQHGLASQRAAASSRQFEKVTRPLIPIDNKEVSSPSIAQDKCNPPLPKDRTPRKME